MAEKEIYVQFISRMIKRLKIKGLFKFSTVSLLLMLSLFKQAKHFVPAKLGCVNYFI